MRLDPRHSAVYLWLLGRVYFRLGHYDEAAPALEKAVERNPGFDQSHLILAAAYAGGGVLNAEQTFDVGWSALLLRRAPGREGIRQGCQRGARMNLVRVDLAAPAVCRNSLHEAPADASGTLESTDLPALVWLLHRLAVHDVVPFMLVEQRK